MMASAGLRLGIAAALTVSGCDSPSGPVSSLDPIWIRPIGLHSQAPQMVAGRVVYSSSGWVVALDLRSGEEGWAPGFGTMRVGPDIAAGPEAVFVGVLGDGLAALDARNGERLWEHFGCACRLLVGDRNHVFAVRAGGLLAFSSTPGERLWESPPPRLDWPIAGFGLGPDVICLAQNEPPGSAVACLNTSGGDAAWVDLEQAREALSDLVVSEGLVIAGTMDTRVLAFDLADGTPAWEADLTSGRAAVELAAGQGVVYACTHSLSSLLAPEVCAALRASDGAVLWQEVIAGQITGISAAESFLLVVSSDELLALDRSTGDAIARVTATEIGPGVAGSLFKGSSAYDDGIAVLRHGDALVALRLP